MKYIKEYNNIDWDDFDIEEVDNELGLPKYLNEFYKENSLWKLRLGDEFIFNLNKSQDKNIKGRIISNNNNKIGIEFDEYINGHSCRGLGKYGHCWNFNKENTYKLLIKSNL